MACCMSLPALMASEQAPSTNDELINLLIKQLGSDNFKTRDQATRRLSAMEEAYPALRRAMASADPEIRRRAELLVRSFAGRIEKRTRQRLVDTFWSGEDLSIDELIDSVVWHNWVDDECWRVVLAFSRDLGARIGTKGTLQEFRSPVDLRSPCIVRDTWNEFRLEEARLIAKHVDAHGDFKGSTILCRGAVHNGDIYGCLLLATGDIKAKNRGGGYIANSMVFCDGDVIAGKIVRSVIVATGSVKSDSATSCFIIENARNPLPFLKLFDPSQAGIEVSSTKEGVRVENVHEGKRFAKAGVERGDVLVAVDKTKITSAEQFRKLLRRLVVENREGVFRLQRGHKTLEVVLPF